MPLLIKVSKTYKLKFMDSKTRNCERFVDIGRVTSEEICPFAGILENISMSGCKVHYQFPVVVDSENDYELKITFARAAGEGSLEILCHPQWVKEEEGATDIGFMFLPSKDLARLEDYINKLNLDLKGEGLSDQIDDTTSCQLI